MYLPKYVHIQDFISILDGMDFYNLYPSLVPYKFLITGCQRMFLFSYYLFKLFGCIVCSTFLPLSKSFLFITETTFIKSLETI